MSNVYLYSPRPRVPDHRVPHRFPHPQTFVIKMDDIAQKVSERLYGDDEVKYEIILTLLHVAQKLDEDIRYFSEGNLDEYMKGIIEVLEDMPTLKN